MPKRNRFFGTLLASKPDSSSYKIGCVVEDIAISRLDLYTAENGLHFQAPQPMLAVAVSSVICYFYHGEELFTFSIDMES